MLLAVPLVALPVLLVVLTDLLVAQPVLVLPAVLALPPRREQLPAVGHCLQPMLLLSQGCTNSIPHNKLTCWRCVLENRKQLVHQVRHLQRRSSHCRGAIGDSHRNPCKGKKP